MLFRALFLLCNQQRNHLPKKIYCRFPSIPENVSALRDGVKKEGSEILLWAEVENAKLQGTDVDNRDY